MKTHQKDYHCCATCENFLIVKDGRTKYKCTRLNFETYPKWRFDCWQPREDIYKPNKKHTYGGNE